MEITVEEMRRLSPEDYILIDMRNEQTRDYGVIPGALPVSQKELESNPPETDGRKLILYCAHGQFSLDAAEALREKGIDESLIRAVACHGWPDCVDIEPQLEMEKVLFAVDELTGLIGAAAMMRPSKSVDDMELKSLKKKFKDKKFAAGCSRDVIQKGAELLGWELDDLMDRTLQAMRASPNVD